MRDFSPYGPLTSWVKVLMANFKISQYEAIIILGKCHWPKPPLETITFEGENNVPNPIPTTNQND